MLSKQTRLGHYEVHANGIIFVEEIIEILEDGLVIGSKTKRISYEPRVVDESNPRPDTGYEEVNNAIQQKWTNEIINAYIQQTQQQQEQLREI